MSHRGALTARIIGMLVFLLGVGLLLIVFRAAYDLFTASPNVALGLKFTGDPKTDPSAAHIGTQFGWLLIKIAFLFIMSVSGSLVAQKGINMYFTTPHVAGEPTESRPAQTPVSPSV